MSARRAGNRRTKPAEERCADLLDAAEHLVLQNPDGGFTVDDLTARAGVAKGTFYLHFSNKSDLLDALRERYAHRFAETQLAHARNARGDAVIQAWMRAGVAEYVRDVRLHDVLFHPTARGERNVSHAVIDTLTELLVALERPPHDPEATAIILYAAMHGVADHIIHTPRMAERMLVGLDGLVRSILSADLPTATPEARNGPPSLTHRQQKRSPAGE